MHEEMTLLTPSRLDTYLEDITDKKTAMGEMEWKDYQECCHKGGEQDRVRTTYGGFHGAE